MEEVIKRIEVSGHQGFINDVVDFLILRIEDKTNCVLPYGAPNSGKTTFTKCLSEIFPSAFYK